MYGFIYITTNKINNKQYIGSHNGSNKYYLGSGILIKKAIKKEGRKNFEIKILKEFDDIKKARLEEEKYIIEYNTLNPNGYNISPKGGLTLIECHSLETRKKIGDRLRGKRRTQSQKDLMSIRAKEREIHGSQKYFTELQKFTIIRLHLMLKFPVNRIADIMGIHKDRIKRFLSKDKLYRPFGIHNHDRAIGSKRSDATRLKISIAQKNN